MDEADATQVQATRQPDPGTKLQAADDIGSDNLKELQDDLYFRLKLQNCNFALKYKDP